MGKTFSFYLNVDVLSMTQNNIQWSDSSSGALGECKILDNRHYSQDHSESEWYYLLGSHKLILKLLVLDRNN